MLVILLLLLIESVLCSSLITPTPTEREICTEAAVDVGFIMDSSGSVSGHYQDEKNFIKDIATAFLARSNNNRAGVVTFSGYAELSIGLGNYRPMGTNDHVNAFRNAVDAIGYHGGDTRIDLGLNVAKDRMFPYSEVGRDNVQKILILLTDGHTDSCCDPVSIAAAMRRTGVTIVVIGIGGNIDVNVLQRIGGAGNYYGAASFAQLVTDQFVSDITKESCKKIYSPAEDGKFYKPINETKMFDPAKVFCQNEGAHLLIADSPQTMNIISKNYASFSIWLGAQYDSQRGAWFWLDGQPVRQEAWGQQGPRGSNVCLTAREGRLYHSDCTAGHVFVCQKGATRPDQPMVWFVEEQVSGSNFKCEFQRKRFSIPATYEVTWFVSWFNSTGARLVETDIIVDNRNYSNFFASHHHHAHGRKVYAKVRVWYTDESNTKSEYAISNEVYTGIELHPWAVTVVEGGPSVAVRIRPNVPILCNPSALGSRHPYDCNMTIFFDFTNGPHDIIANPCHLVFTPNNTEWKTITLKAKRGVVGNGLTTRMLRLLQTRNEKLGDSWKYHAPIDIQVRRMSVSGGRCTSTGDPHIRTFDGVFYDHYHVGDYVLVKSFARDFQIHVRTQKCSYVSCNCGVTVKEGADVLSINMCGKYAAPDVQYLSNKEPRQGTRIERSPNGKTFIIKLTSEASVKFVARPWSNTFYADITVELPSDDFNRTVGLCGNMDGVQWNDHMDRNGSVRSGCGRQACTAFTESWKLSKSESLFCFNGGEEKCLGPRDDQMEEIEENETICGAPGTTPSTNLRRNVITDRVTNGYKKMVFPGQPHCDAERNSTTPNDVIVLHEDLSDVKCDHHESPTQHGDSVLPSFPTPSGRTENDVRSWCRGQIQGSNVYTVCRHKKGNTLSVDGFVEQCVEDIKILDDQSVALQSAVEAMKSLCGDIMIGFCPNECSFRGRCENGTCNCTAGYTTEDCSVEANQIPEIDTAVILCDVRQLPCSKVKIRSRKLIPGNIVCGMRSNNGALFIASPAELLNFAEVSCKLPDRYDVTDRFVVNAVAMATYVVTLSNNNNGIWSRDGAAVVVYDSKCMVCSNATMSGGNVEAHCQLKEDTCLIHGYCYGNGDVDPTDSKCRICDPSRSTTMFLIGDDKPIECRDHTVFNLQCTKESLTATWETGVFITNAPLLISLRDPHCNVFSQNGTHTSITTSFTECGTEIIQHGDLIIQENVATVTVLYQNNIIIRRTSYVYNFSCVFDRRLNVMTAITFLADDRQSFGEGNGTSSFSASIKMFESSSYLQVLTEDPVKVITFEPMYFQIRSQNKNKGLKFVVEQCYAVPTTGSQVGKYIFFDMKCPTFDPTFKISDYSNNHFNFEIEAFRFIEAYEKSIRVHCKLLVCKANSMLPECQQECATRKRRDVKEDSKREEEWVESCSITYKKKKTCKDVSCPTNSTCLELYPAECRCNHGYIKDTTTKHCRAEQKLNVRGIHLDMTYLPTYDDQTSIDYLRLVTRLEHQLLSTLQFSRTIQGLKVIKVHRGSVVADVALIYSRTESKEAVFESFFNSIMAYARNNNNTLKFLPGMAPTMDVDDVPRDEGSDDYKKVLVVEKVSYLQTYILAGVLLLVIAVAVMNTVLCHRRHHKRNATTAENVEMDQGVTNFGIDMGDVPCS